MTKQYTREEIEELLKNASPFEWRVEPDPDYPDQCHGIVDANGDIIVETDAGHYPPKIHDAKFIAASPTIVRQLLDQIKILEEGLEWYADPANYVDLDGDIYCEEARETLEKAR